jgi:mannose-6-phosphate isomerase-like protein (cupin superfamily)
VAGARTEIKKGKKGGLQYHHKKEECGFIISGKLLVRYDNGNGKLLKKILKRGQSFHFPPGAVHQEEALTNVRIIEASTPYFNDRVRVEKKYNLQPEKGLPSTKKKDVIFK